MLEVRLRTQVLPAVLAPASAQTLNSNQELDEVRSKMKPFSKGGGDAHDRKQ